MYHQVGYSIKKSLSITGGVIKVIFVSSIGAPYLLLFKTSYIAA